MEENKNIEMQAAGDTPEAVDQKPMSEVEKVITPKTKAILICNPANPTGKHT